MTWSSKFISASALLGIAWHQHLLLCSTPLLQYSHTTRARLFFPFVSHNKMQAHCILQVSPYWSRQCLCETTTWHGSTGGSDFAIQPSMSMMLRISPAFANNISEQDQYKSIP